ncbi:MAG: DUF3343 domain-containing protein [Clostridia bacterium]|nr:DUF3343 domain-containing protein [Clostridia bacterium]
MKKVIVLSSVTYAMKAQELLKENGIYSSITRSRAVRSVRGCGYGISFEESLFDNVRLLLSKNGIPIVGSTEEK